jgi:hypothetical protein
MLPSAESIQIIIPASTVILLVLSIKRPVYGVIAYFIVLNAKIGDMYPVLGAIRFELLTAIFVMGRIVLAGRGLLDVLPRVSRVNSWLWILFFTGMASVAFSLFPAVSWSEGGYFLLKMTVFYVMIVSAVRTSGDLVKFLWAFILVTAWIAYEPVVNYLSGNVDEQLYGAVAFGRFGAATGHVALANTLNQVMPVLVFFAFRNSKGLVKAVSVALLALLVFGVYASKSRGGFLGLMATAAGVVYFSRDRMKAALIAGAFAFVFLGVAAADYLSHMSTITEGVSSSRTIADRYLGLVNGISMMIKRPILGVGIGCYAEARRYYFHYYFYAHNLYGELLGELGLASLAWFTFIYMVYRGASALKRVLNPAWAYDTVYIDILNAIQLSLVVRLLVGNFTHGSLIWFWFLAAALVVVVRNVLSRERQVPYEGLKVPGDGSRYSTLESRSY